MYKQSTLLGIVFVIASCGQVNERAVVKATNDSTVVSTNSTTPTSVANSTDTSDVKMKHQAYNEDIKDLPPSLAQYVPEGYTALHTTSGHLDLDQYDDMIMVLKKNGEDTSSNVVDHPEKRPLFILLGQSDNTYRLAARNDNAVYCIDCGGMMGDPFMQVVIKNGYFSIEHYGGSAWRWTRTITFKYSRDDKYWYLHKDGGESFHASEPGKMTAKVRTIKEFGKVPFDKFDIYKED